MSSTDKSGGKHSKDDMSTTGGPLDPTDVALNSGAYALNALSPEETQEFEAYLAESDTTRNEVTELAETAALLGLSVAPVEPSPELKTNIMAMLASTPQLPRDVAPMRSLHAEPVSEAALSEVALPSEAALPPTELSAKSAKIAVKTQARWFNRPILAITAVAAALALIVGGSVVANLVGDLSDARLQASQLAEINAADDMQQASAEVSTGGTATLVWSAELGKSAVIADGLAELPDGKTYELWYIDAAGNPTAAGFLDTSDTEQAWLVLEGEMSAGDTVGVTVEPKGGSEQPTTDPIVAITSA